MIENADTLKMPVITRTQLLAIILAAPALQAQWLKYPTAGVPRLPNGQPNLSAPAPRTPDGKPDLSGLWEPAAPAGSSTFLTGDPPGDRQFSGIGVNLPGGLPLQPWARELVETRRDGEFKDAPDTYCLPLGLVQMHVHPYPRKLIQVPGLLLILFERDTTYRQIFTDGRPLPVDPQPGFNGYSTGKWEGDTLVVESIGFKDGMWLDTKGSPLTSAAKVTERFRRPSFGKLEIEITIDDPMAYTKPWSIQVHQALALDTDLVEFVCLENEKDLSHLVGK
jgi:hypothetical protein